MLQTKFVEKLRTHILYSITFSWISCRLWDILEKYCRPVHAADGNMAHALCMLGNLGYRQTRTKHVILIVFHGNNG